MFLSIPIRLQDKNFNPDYASYVTIETGTGLESLKKVNQWTVDNSYKRPDGSYRLNADWLTQGRTYAYRVTAYNNQYATAVMTGSIIIPRVIPTTGSGANLISRTGDSLIA